MHKRDKVILVRAGPSGKAIPHALLALAANLKDKVLILDEATPDLVIKYKDEIKNAICVGISTITGPHIKHSLEVARQIRGVNPCVPLVWGGWHPSLKPRQTLKNKYVDKVIIGQGEKAFQDLVENIKKGKKTEDIIAYNYIDKNNFPIYNFKLIKDIEKYIVPHMGSRTITLYTQQGCPYGCKFCAINSVYGKKYSGWDIDRVIILIRDTIKKYGINGVYFDDDNFFIDKKRALEFADKLLKRDIKINWGAAAGINILSSLNTEEWELLDRSGCKRLSAGAESGSQRTLDMLNKRIAPQMIIEFANLCYKYNIIPCLSLMVGVPGETQEDIEETFKLLAMLKEKVPTTEPVLSLYTPYPGTPLYEVALKMGYKEPQSLEGWAEHYLDNPTTPWIDQSLGERVKKYNASLPTQKDYTLKFKQKPRISVYIRRFSRLLRKKDKKETILNRYFKKKK